MTSAKIPFVTGDVDHEYDRAPDPPVPMGLFSLKPGRLLHVSDSKPAVRF